MAQEEIWELRPEEFSYQFAYFSRLTPKGKLLGGERARKFFLQSGLSYDVLGAIWRLSDVDQDGELSAAEFAIAMHLVHVAIKGKQLPSTLPQALVNFLNAVTQPKLPPPAENHLQKCRSAFVSFQTNNGKGVLGAEAAKYLLTKSNLPRETIVHIWSLADEDRDGYLTFLEFTVAMHLIYVAKLGHYLPLQVNAKSLFPSTYYTFIGDVQSGADRLPATQQPYVDPITPQGTPTSPDDSKGFISSQHFTMPPEAFRDRGYNVFVGNPFAILTTVNGEVSEQDPPSGGSSPSSGSTASTHSVVKEVVVEEYTEPVVQQVGPVQIVMTPANFEEVELSGEEKKEEEVVEDVKHWEGGGRQEEQEVEQEEVVEDVKHWEDGERQEEQEVEQEEVEYKEEGGEKEDSDHDDLEDISRASRKFLDDTEDIPQEEDIHWVTPGSCAPFGMDQYRSAGMKGLSETIEEMGIEDKSEEVGVSVALKVPPSSAEAPVRVPSPQSGAARVISHMQQLEAQILSALADTSGLIPEEEEAYNAKDTEALLAEMLNQRVESPDPLEQQRALLESSLHAIIKVSGGAPPTEDVSSGRTSSPSIVPSECPLSGIQQQAIFGAKAADLPKAEVQAPLSSVDANLDMTQSNKVPAAVSSGAKLNPTTPPKTDKKPNVTSSTPTSAPAPAGNLSSTGGSRDKKLTNKPAMDDLDAILGDELASINDVFAEFEATDRKSKAPAVVVEPIKKPATPVVINVPSLDQIRKKKDEESKIIAQQWEEEARKIEQEKLKELEKKKAFLQESNSTVQTLEHEWQTLLQQEEQLVKEAQKEKEARLVREQEEQARLAKEREARPKPKPTPEELPLEEWIEWVEKNRLKEMTPEQRVEYERKKKLRVDALREKEEQRKREEEEKLRKAREKMSEEQRMYAARETDIKVSRIDTEELKRLQEENAKKEAEEKRQREEKARQWKEKIKQAEIEELKPKAKSSLAARWEESVKNRTSGSKDYKSTVLGTQGIKSSTTVMTRKSSTGQ